MFLVTLTGLVLAWSARESSRVATSVRLNHSLSQLEDDGKLFVVADYETRFPQVISQLFNHGKHPWGSFFICSRVKSGSIELSLGKNASPDEIDRIAKLAMESGYAIALEVLDFNSERQTMLCAFDGADVSDLTIDFNTDYWVYDENAVGFANFKLDLKMNLPNLESLTLELDSRLDQVDQLRPFVGLPSLKGSIFNISEEGAEFILKTKEQWPDYMEFDFVDDVSEELRLKLESEFNAKSSPPIQSRNHFGPIE